MQAIAESNDQWGLTRALHPAGTGRVDRVVAPGELAVIADGLAQGVAGATLEWTEAVDRRYCSLLATDLFNAWIIEWAPSSGLDLHDHGGSVAAIRVIGGRLIESYAERLSTQPLRTRAVAAGDSFAVPARRIHGVVNPGPGIARSVHVYSPPLCQMTFFDEVGERTLPRWSSAEDGPAGG